MRMNHVKAHLRHGSVSLGGWLALPAVPVARLMAVSGFDWLMVDMEHSAQDVGLMSAMVAAIAESETCAPLVRVPTGSVEWFKWALDAGAWGVLVPMVSTRVEAEQAVQWARYPPLGIRSVGGAFPHHTFRASRAEYNAAANDEILVIVQIEGTDALANLDAILSVSGIDAAFVGPYDLRAQLGLPPADSGNEPAFQAALEDIKRVARQYRLPLGIYCSSKATAAQRISEGFRMVAVISDAACLKSAASDVLRQLRGYDEA